MEGERISDRSDFKADRSEDLKNKQSRTQRETELREHAVLTWVSLVIYFVFTKKSEKQWGK